MENITLTPEEERDLALGTEMGFNGHYCQQCRRCVPQCPAGMDIPTLMRSHMYAFGHRRPAKARHTLRSWTSADIACAACSVCAVQCSVGFDVRSRALEIARILDVPEEFLG
ncbi:MAG: 4Fe-4S dicluster domain-containing protein [bacterium]